MNPSLKDENPLFGLGILISLFDFFLVTPFLVKFITIRVSSISMSYWWWLLYSVVSGFILMCIMRYLWLFFQCDGFNGSLICTVLLKNPGSSVFAFILDFVFLYIFFVVRKFDVSIRQCAVISILSFAWTRSVGLILEYGFFLN